MRRGRRLEKLVVHEDADGPAGEIDLEYVAAEGIGDVQVARRVERDRVEAAAGGRAAADGKNLGRCTGVGKRRREFDHVASAEICHVEIARCIERQSERNRSQQRDGVQQAPIVAEDVDDVGRGKVERRDINVPLRIGGNSLGVAGARRQRGKADDATFIRVCRKDTDGQQQPGHEKCKNCFTHIASLVCIDPFTKRCSRL